MANSRQPQFYRDPFQPPSLTPGPLGHNDAASPNAPKTLRIDTPGPLGINDHGCPSARPSGIPTTSRLGLKGPSEINENASEEVLVKDPRVKALLDVIAHAEGADYNTMVKGAGSMTITDFARHPNVTVSLGKFLKSTAAGRYQFLYSTWVGLKMPDFSPRSQDIAAVKLFKRRNMLRPLFRGDVEQAILNGNREWASLPGSPYGQPTRKMGELLEVYSRSLVKWKNK